MADHIIDRYILCAQRLRAGAHERHPQYAHDWDFPDECWESVGVSEFVQGEKTLPDDGLRINGGRGAVEIGWAYNTASPSRLLILHISRGKAVAPRG